MKAFLIVVVVSMLAHEASRAQGTGLQIGHFAKGNYLFARCTQPTDQSCCYPLHLCSMRGAPLVGRGRLFRERDKRAGAANGFLSAIEKLQRGLYRGGENWMLRAERASAFQSQKPAPPLVGYAPTVRELRTRLDRVLNWGRLEQGA